MTCTANNGEGCASYNYSGQCEHTYKLEQGKCSYGSYLSNHCTGCKAICAFVATAEAKGRREMVKEVREMVQQNPVCLLDEYLPVVKTGTKDDVYDFAIANWRKQLLTKLDTAFPLE